MPRGAVRPCSRPRIPHRYESLFLLRSASSHLSLADSSRKLQARPGLRGPRQLAVTGSPYLYQGGSLYSDSYPGLDECELVRGTSADVSVQELGFRRTGCSSAASFHKNPKVLPSGETDKIKEETSVWDGQSEQKNPSNAAAAVRRGNQTHVRFNEPSQ